MKRFLLSCIYLIFCSTIYANNIKLDSLKLIDSVNISVKISWDNNWNLPDTEPFNHDAAWLFFKYKNGGIWKHLNLSSNSSDHVCTETYAEAVAVNDSKGLFIKRSDTGEGLLATTLFIKLESPLLPGSYDFRAFAVEMVYIPEGSFYIGDSISNNTFRKASGKGPFKISSENEIIVGSSGTMLDNTIGSAPEGNIPSFYPKGFRGYYSMKYEISQEQYVDFLNTLTYTQQATRTTISPSSSAGSFVMNPTASQTNRNAIVLKTPGSSSQPAVYSVNADNDSNIGEPEDGSSRACSYLSWHDLTGYLDWSCLRPMTEFEFEKSCRGTGYPISLEFAWGTDKVTDANSIQNDGTFNETVLEKGDTETGVASHGYTGPQGPIRCGFNGSSTSTRNESGSGYYGVKEMSGNIWEQCVAVNAAGLSFNGNSGDGTLTSSGNADVSGWDLSGTGVAIRGGGWNSGIQTGFRDLAVSDRFYGFFNTTTRRNTTGGRGCRTF